MSDAGMNTESQPGTIPDSAPALIPARVVIDRARGFRLGKTIAPPTCPHG